MERVSLTWVLSLYKNAAVRVQTIPVPLTGVLITYVIRVPFYERLQSRNSGYVPWQQSQCFLTAEPDPQLSWMRHEFRFLSENMAAAAILSEDVWSIRACTTGNKTKAATKAPA